MKYKMHRGGIDFFTPADNARKSLVLFDRLTIDTDEARQSIAQCRKYLCQLETKLTKAEQEEA